MFRAVAITICGLDITINAKQQLVSIVTAEQPHDDIALEGLNTLSLAYLYIFMSCKSKLYASTKCVTM